MNQHWQYWKAALSDGDIEYIKSCGEAAPVANAGLGFHGDGNNPDYRSSEIHWLNTRLPIHNNITEMLWYFAREANKNAFGFNIDTLSDIQYTKYNATENGHYDWHYDTFWANPTAYDRKLSIVVQLSDPTEYTGGDFEIDVQLPQPSADEIKIRGTVIVFPSFFLHRVTPVTAGTRCSLVSWIQGPKFR